MACARDVTTEATNTAPAPSTSGNPGHDSATNTTPAPSTSGNHEPDSENTTPTPSTSGNPATDSDLWTTENVSVLLAAYVEFKDSKRRWSLIAAEVANFSKRKVDQEKCRLKIKGLKEKFQRQTKHNNTSGNERINIDSALEEAFAADLTSTEVKALESSQKKTTNQKRDATVMMIAGDDPENEESENQENVPPAKMSKKKSKQSGVDRLIAYLKSDKEKEEEAEQKRHNEKIDVLNRLIDTIKKN